MRRFSFCNAFTALAAFWRNTRGVAAVEFALIAPLMAMLYIGTAEISQALTVDRKLTYTASALADLVAQDTRITDDEMGDIMEASSAMLAPFDSAPLQLVVTSVVADSHGDTEVDWSDAKGGDARSEGSKVTLPEGLTGPGDSIIMAEVSYTYSSPFSRFITDGFVMEDRFYLRPRRVAVIERGN